jgi:hypothetical protein
MLYREIIAVCSEIHTKHKHKLCWQNVELLNVKPGGRWSGHLDSHGWTPVLDVNIEACIFWTSEGTDERPAGRPSRLCPKRRRAKAQAIGISRTGVRRNVPDVCLVQNYKKFWLCVSRCAVRAVCGVWIETATFNRRSDTANSC